MTLFTLLTRVHLKFITVYVVVSESYKAFIEFQQVVVSGPKEDCCFRAPKKIVSLSGAQLGNF